MLPSHSSLLSLGSLPYRARRFLILLVAPLLSTLFGIPLTLVSLVGNSLHPPFLPVSLVPAPHLSLLCVDTKYCDDALETRVSLSLAANRVKNLPRPRYVVMAATLQQYTTSLLPSAESCLTWFLLFVLPQVDDSDEVADGIDPTWRPTYNAPGSTAARARYSSAEAPARHPGGQPPSWGARRVHSQPMAPAGGSRNFKLVCR